MKEPITERLAEAPEAEGLLREAMELLGAIGVSKAGKHERHNACVIRNRIDAYLQHQQMALARADAAPPALARPLDLGPIRTHPAKGGAGARGGEGGCETGRLRTN